MSINRVATTLGLFAWVCWSLGGCSGGSATTPQATATPSAIPATETQPSATATQPPATPTATAVPVCGDGRLARDEGCDDGDTADGDGCSQTCQVEFLYTCLGEPSVCSADPAECGDGRIHPSEGCDDGGTEGGDGCSADCQVEPLYTCRSQPSQCTLLPAVCGDGLIHPDEDCDDHNPIGGDGCSEGCEVEDFYVCAGQPSGCELVPVDCGDGEVHPLEQCDDGEANSDEDPDACRTDCTLPSCGDGVLDEGEQCDDGPANSDTAPGACRTDCKPARCGDGVPEGAEQCDDGDENSNVTPDACRTDCKPARCGDGITDAAEGCDAGPNNSDIIPDACRVDCSKAGCGDGIIDTGETCDDGDDNSDTLPGACRLSCQLPTCGDGIIDPLEECDDGPGNVDGLLGACNTGCQVALEYEKVVTVSAAGAAIAGSFEALDRRMWDEAASCRVRFDGRIHNVTHVERTEIGYFLDFQGLSAWDGDADGYAYIALEPGVRAALATSKRLSAVDKLILKDRAQSEEVSKTPLAVDVFCSRRNPYALTGRFGADGLATVGSFDATFAAAVDRAADCKVRLDDRLFDTPHVEYDDYLLRLDVTGLGEARLNASEAYVSVEIAAGVHSRYAVLTRRGNVNQVYYKDLNLAGEVDWTYAPVEVLCADRYAPVLTMAQGGTVVAGSGFLDLMDQLVDEGRRCKARFDNRVTTPSHIEHGDGYIRMDLMNQHAYNDGADAVTYIDLDLDTRAGIGAVFRRGLDTVIPKPTLEQLPSQGSAQVGFEVDVLCEHDPAWVQTYGMSASGADTLGSWTDFYNLVTTQAVECRLATEGQIGDPVLVEYTTGQLLFDYHGLAAYAGGRDAYALHFMARESQSSRAGSYRRGSPQEVYKRDRAQASLSAVSPVDVRAFCR